MTITARLAAAGPMVPPVPVLVGDTVIVTAYGYGARLSDVGRVGTVTALNRTRAVVTFHNTSNYGGAATRPIGGGCLMITRRAA